MLRLGASAGEDGAYLVSGNAFSSPDGLYRTIKAGVQDGNFVGSPLLFRVDEIEGMREEFLRVGEATAVKLTMNALFELRVEGKRHGLSIPPARS